MTREETIKLVSVISIAYPNAPTFRDEKQIRGMVTLWASVFSGDDVSLVSMAVNKHINTSKWPPAVAEIREAMAEITRPGLLTPDEAWGIAHKFMSTAGEYVEAHEIDKKLPGMIAKAVETVGYKTLRGLDCLPNLGHRDKAGLARMAFIKAYEPLYKQYREDAMLPASLKAQITAVKAVHIAGADTALLLGVEKTYEEQKERDRRRGLYLDELYALEEAKELLITEGIVKEDKDDG